MTTRRLKSFIATAVLLTLYGSVFAAAPTLQTIPPVPFPSPFPTRS
jgi:hypothetical protein